MHAVDSNSRLIKAIPKLYYNIVDKVQQNWLAWLVQDRSSLKRYSGALLSSSAALLCNFVLRDITERNLFFLSMATISLTSSILGYGPGLLTTFLTAFGLNYFFLGNPDSFRLETTADLSRISIFLLSGILMVFLGGTLLLSLRKLKKAQEQAEEAVKTRDEFISMASHELRTPLTALRLNMQLGLHKYLNSTQTDRKEREEYEKLLRISESTLTHLNSLIDDMLDLSKVTHGRLKLKLSPTDLKLIVTNVLDRLDAELKRRKYIIKLNIPEGIIGVWDQQRIEQIVSNLLSNAIKYGNGNPIEINANATQYSAQLAVSDHGPGISEEDKDKLFHQFERLNASESISGVGLGLYITKKMIELHHGRIWVESILGEGTTFHVELPRNMKAEEIDLKNVS